MPTRQRIDDLGLEILVQQAHINGYKTPEQVQNRLLDIIARKGEYLDYLHRVNHDHSRDTVEQTDREVLALAVRMLRGEHDAERD